MITEKTTIRTESVYSDDSKKRYSLSIEWDKQKKKALVIMVSAGNINGVAFDNSTNLVFRHMLGNGAVLPGTSFQTAMGSNAVWL